MSQPTTASVAQNVEPWHVGERPKPSAMLPIRTHSGKAVGYAYKGAAAILFALAPEILAGLKRYGQHLDSRCRFSCRCGLAELVGRAEVAQS